MRRSVPETRVLVVDADASSLETLAVALLDSGFAVRTAASGAEALAEARKRPPSLVLTEIAMPGMDGIQLCAAFRGDPGLGDVPIVLLTGGQTDPRLRERVATAGASDYLTKPIDLPRLVQVIRGLSA
jgi:two-component system, sensor histidine kinase and response regulator